MYRAIAILFVCGLSLWGQRIVVQPDDSGKEGTLQILYVTSFGEPATAGVELTVENVANGKEVPIERTGTLKLPYGTYRLRARITAHYPAERIVKIQEPFQTTSLCFFEAQSPGLWRRTSSADAFPRRAGAAIAAGFGLSHSSRTARCWKRRLRKTAILGWPAYVPANISWSPPGRRGSAKPPRRPSEAAGSAMIWKFPGRRSMLGKRRDSGNRNNLRHPGLSSDNGLILL